MQEHGFSPHSMPDDAAADALRVPPHSIQGEQSVLGGLMLDNNAWDQIADRVVEQDFSLVVGTGIMVISEYGSSIIQKMLKDSCLMN